MQPNIQYRTSEPPSSIDHATPRLRTVTGNRWPRGCACGCGQQIPRGPDTRLVVDFGAPRPYPAYLREHSPDYTGARGRSAPATEPAPEPEFVPGRKFLERHGLTEQANEESSPSPESGRSWTSGQLVFHTGSFESARSGFADYARPGETAAQLRERVNRVIIEDLELKVFALRALHAKLHDLEAGESFGDVVARGRPKSEMV